ncbi:hypothetical protein F511_12677 [Dorcoceras hygrometricum]|uniref:Uncharacterized protein n=1 Tax=Dorcoceras hygrometricum TaxID=472368 RepID=A0A2Z7D7Y7_9LAMI|nr:hypothetical protein F511_12677 [Dorcoceras hygrometricum]
MVYQPGKSSVRDHRGPSAYITARWYSETTTQSVTTPMIALDLSGTTNQSAGHNVALNQELRTHGLSITDSSWLQQPRQEVSKAATTQENQNSKITKLHKLGSHSAILSQVEFTPPSWYQSKEQLKENPASPISFKTTAEITGNLPEKSSGEQ